MKFNSASIGASQNQEVGKNFQCKRWTTRTFQIEELGCHINPWKKRLQEGLAVLYLPTRKVLLSSFLSCRLPWRELVRAAYELDGILIRVYIKMIYGSYAMFEYNFPIARNEQTKQQPSINIHSHNSLFSLYYRFHILEYLYRYVYCFHLFTEYVFSPPSPLILISTILYFILLLLLICIQDPIFDTALEHRFSHAYNKTETTFQGRAAIATLSREPIPQYMNR